MGVDGVELGTVDIESSENESGANVSLVSVL